ncbi:MAG TPA: hypothetical protein VK577_17795 [Bradyrhizobium sp.]|nr:hypothetical protein [Bradyrhizobium sp.]
MKPDSENQIKGSVARLTAFLELESAIRDCSIGSKLSLRSAGIGLANIRRAMRNFGGTRTGEAKYGSGKPLRLGLFA